MPPRRSNALEGRALVVAELVEDDAAVDLAALGLAAGGLPGLLGGGAAADEDDLLVGVALVVLGVAPLLLSVFGQEAPHRLLQHAHPALDGRRALGRVAQLARHVAHGLAGDGGVRRASRGGHGALPAVGGGCGALLLDALA